MFGKGFKTVAVVYAFLQLSGSFGGCHVAQGLRASAVFMTNIGIMAVPSLNTYISRIARGALAVLTLSQACRVADSDRVGRPIIDRPYLIQQGECFG